MAALSNPPLTTNDLRAINQALAALNSMLPELDKAKAAGMDTAQWEMGRQNLYDALQKVKEQYFPGK